jgi:hypothetical protein
MTRADKLFKRLKAARLDNTVEAELRRLAHTLLLIIDDFCLQALDATETADFCEIVVERHHKAATAVTSNREPSEWLAMMADPLLAQFAVDPPHQHLPRTGHRRRLLPPPTTAHHHQPVTTRRHPRAGLANAHQPRPGRLDQH